MAEEADIRIGDAERGDARTLLDEHLSAGRLTIAEHEERHALAGVARTRGELKALFDDLPLPHPDLSAVARPVKRPEPGPTGPVATVAYVTCAAGLLIGLPAAVALTIMYGWWWLFIVAFVVVVAGLTVGGATDKSQIES